MLFLCRRVFLNGDMRDEKASTAYKRVFAVRFAHSSPDFVGTSQTRETLGDSVLKFKPERGEARDG